MLIPSQPVEGRRIDRFRPPHCPWPECPDHRPTKRYRCKREGSFRRRVDPRRRVPRFRCPTCGRTFSLQSFACTYYSKRPELLLPVAAGLVAGSAHRQIARSLGCAPSTVTRLAARMGRHALLLQRSGSGSPPPRGETERAEAGSKETSSPERAWIRRAFDEADIRATPGDCTRRCGGRQ